MPSPRALVSATLVSLACAAFVPAAAENAPPPSAAVAVSPVPPHASVASGSIAAEIPVRRDGAASDTSQVFRAWTIALVLLGITALALWWFRASARPNAPRLAQSPLFSGGQLRHKWWAAWPASGAGAPVHLISSKRLTPQHSVHVVHWQGKAYLLGCCAQDLRVIDTSPLPDTDAQPQDPPAP